MLKLIVSLGLEGVEERKSLQIQRLRSTLRLLEAFVSNRYPSGKPSLLKHHFAPAPVFFSEGS